MNRTTIPLFLLCVAVLAGCKTTEQATAPAMAEEELTQAHQTQVSTRSGAQGEDGTDEASKYATASEIQAALDGKCVKGTGWEECYDGSKLVYTQHNITRGSWSIADNPNGAVVTFNYPRWGTVQRYIGIDGATVTYYKMDGSVRATATILEGS